MSSYSDMKLSSHLRYMLATVLALVIIGVIAAAFLIPYFANRPAPLNVDLAAERKAKLADVNAKQNELISTYGWVDKSKGVVRIPVERAMMLTVEELSKKGNVKQDEQDKENKEDVIKN